VVTQDDVLDVLQGIDDPEMPISIVDLGIVEKVELHPAPPAGTRVCVEVIPTFVGCPALPVIEDEIRRRVAALPGVAAVEVRFIHAPAWSVDRITPAGREALRRFGLTVPQAAEGGADPPPSCPYCGSASVRQESAFGPTRCRTIWYCEACRNPFEHLKRLAPVRLVQLALDRLGQPR
jgi:ring-1,2-phenylacetyl-CoA epoxidase subunit PaaD